MVTDNPVRLHHCFHHKGNNVIDCSICPRLSTFSCISLVSMVDAGSLTGVGLCGGANGFQFFTNSARELRKGSYKINVLQNLPLHSCLTC